MTLGPLQTQWVAALRSGYYAQGQTFLNKNDEFCCLGVACELFIKEKARAGSHGIVRYGNETAAAPDDVVKMLGLNNQFGSMKGGVGLSLATMNDHGQTFDEIADFIEANPTLVFTGAF